MPVHERVQTSAKRYFQYTLCLISKSYVYWVDVSPVGSVL